MAHKKKAHKKDKSKEMHHSKGPEAHKEPMAGKGMMPKGHARGK
jgi:hypothetical protein